MIFEFLDTREQCLITEPFCIKAYRRSVAGGGVVLLKQVIASIHVRGRHWGQQITRHALWMAGNEGVERVVLAVDATNLPALEMYRRTGFEIWERRTVYVRFPGGADAPVPSTS